MIKGYKGFKKDLTCNNFQFKENETFKHEGEVMLCSSGFHFCTNPLDVLNYYDLTESEFAEVESETVDAKDDSDSKCVCKEIKIGVKLGIKGFVNACVEFLLKETKPIDNKAASGDYSQLAASGDSSQLAASGDSSQLAASGNSSIAAGIGIDNMAQGKKGNWIVLAEWIAKNGHYVPVCVKSVKIDGKRIKENTYYKLQNKKFVEVK